METSSEDAVGVGSPAIALSSEVALLAFRLAQHWGVSVDVVVDRVIRDRAIHEGVWDAWLTEVRETTRAEGESG